MNLLLRLVDLFLHLDKHFSQVIAHYGVWTYGLLFVILFCETGLVVTPFLPGDSLLFAAGAFAAKGDLHLGLLLPLLILAAVGGDNLNYLIGRSVGPRVFQGERNRFFNREHLLRTQAFYEKYGGRTLIIARFMPIVRTFAPFVAGIGRMPYGRFLAFSVTGGCAWIGAFCLGGYFFGNLPGVRHHFTLVILAVIVVSVLPGVIEAVRHRKSTPREQDAAAS
ncbi:MAG TPA: DedA family protein [Oscillatoriaceae cyanobacterium]